MRPAPILLSLLAVAAVGLGLRVMLHTPAAAGTPHGAALHESQAGVPQGQVFTGLAEEPDDVNPFTAHSGVAQRYVLAFTHDTLLDSDPRTGALRPALATFDAAADGSSCTFRLRDGVCFADGSPMTMEDALFGWELAQGGSLQFGFVDDAFSRVQSVEILDDQTFRVQFRGVHYAAVSVVGQSWIVAKRAFFVDRIADAARRADVPMPAAGTAEFATLLAQIKHECGPGTGPYMLHNPPEGGGWRPRQDVLLERNPHSWRRQQAPGSWNFAGMRLLFRDTTPATDALRRRELDWFSNPMIDEVLEEHPELAGTYRKVAYDHRMLGVYRIIWNCRRPPFDDARVRRALAMLLDLDAVLQAFSNVGTKAKALAKPTSPEYPNDVELLPYDPAGARRLLREAGFDPEAGKPLRVVLLSPAAGYPPMENTLVLFADAARGAGIDLSIRTFNWPGFLAAKNQGQWDALFLLQSFRSWGDPFDFVHSEGADNDGGWRNETADRLATAARTELDPQRRTAMLRELHELVYREQPTTFLLHPLVTLLLNKHVEGAEPGPLGLCLDRAFVPTEFQRR